MTSQRQRVMRHAETFFCCTVICKADLFNQNCAIAADCWLYRADICRHGSRAVIIEAAAMDCLLPLLLLFGYEPTRRAT